MKIILQCKLIVMFLIFLCKINSYLLFLISYFEVGVKYNLGMLLTNEAYLIIFINQ